MGRSTRGAFGTSPCLTDSTLSADASIAASVIQRRKQSPSHRRSGDAPRNHVPGLGSSPNSRPIRGDGPGAQEAWPHAGRIRPVPVVIRIAPGLRDRVQFPGPAACPLVRLRTHSSANAWKNPSALILCGRCGAERLIPLTFTPSRRDDRDPDGWPRPAGQPVFKCLECGRHLGRADLARSRPPQRQKPSSMLGPRAPDPAIREVGPSG
jgi:hypothetical protein